MIDPHTPPAQSLSDRRQRSHGRSRAKMHASFVKRQPHAQLLNLLRMASLVNLYHCIYWPDGYLRYLLKLPRSPDSTLSVPPHVDERTSVISSPTTTDLSSNAPQSYVRPPTLRTTTSSRNTSRTLNGDDGQSNAAESCPDTAPGNIAWELHIKSTTSETGEVLYICEYGGKCGYSSTKQSVKRHVLGTHLKFKQVI